MKKPIRVIHVKGQLGPDGATMILLNLARCLKGKVVFDFVLWADNDSEQEKEFRKLGSRIYKIGIKTKNPIKRELDKIFRYTKFFRHHKYRIAHFATDSPRKFDMILCAKVGGVKQRITHSHNSFCERDNEHISNNFLHKIEQKLTYDLSTVRMACSKEAAEWLFPPKYVDNVVILNNGINWDSYRYSEEVRSEVRREYNIPEDTFLIGHVGRLAEQKNHKFLIGVFDKLHKEYKNTKLMLVGDGPLKDKCVEDIERRGLTDEVIFTGACTDVSRFLSAMDVFAFPSVFEGLPLTVIEAQANGLTCIASDAITKAVNLDGKVTFLPVDKGEDEWVSNLVSVMNKDRSDRSVVPADDFDIRKTADQLYKLYKDLM